NRVRGAVLRGGETCPVRAGLMRADKMATRAFSVFISSTFVDLVEYREAVHTAIRQLRHHADDMIYWSADDRAAAAASAENVRAADLLILLVAHKYGSSPSDDPRSFTHLEYDTARQADIPVLAFFVDPTFPWPPLHIEFE